MKVALLFTTKLTIALTATGMLVACTSLAPHADHGLARVTGFAPHPIDILHYTARIEPDIVARTINGRVALRFTAASNGVTHVDLDNDGLSVDAVNEAGSPLAFEQRDRRLNISLARPASRSETREIVIDYHGAPRFGLQFHPERQQVYTIFSTSQWLIGIDAPDERATLDLSVILPRDWKAAANGRLVDQQTLESGKHVSRWRQDQPVSSYTFGFVAGRFNEVNAHQGRTRLRYLASDLAPAQLRQVFADTGDMLRYFEQRAGTAYPGDSYTQALVADTIGQEMAGFSVVSEDYGRELLADPHAVSLLAHEAAHQWWGNSVTCRDWNHFWLNEGFATFMAATYLEHRFGATDYAKRVEAWRLRYEALRTAGTDKPLVFPEWIHPTADDRAVVYQKGAYVLHRLRQELGEDDFWKSIRVYTREYMDHSVTTEDFQKSLQRSTGKDLSTFFADWVYSTRPTKQAEDARPQAAATR